MHRQSIGSGLALVSFFLCVSCNSQQFATIFNPTAKPIEIRSAKIKTIVMNAVNQTGVTRGYDPAYVKLTYPGGDVPMTTGVCTDVVIRALRSINIDLQKEVHEDMQRNFAAYPRNWGLTAPDSNIDHRRVPNIMVWLQRKGKAVPMTNNPQDYQPGDIVTWDFGGGQQHIGLVSNMLFKPNRFGIVHNVGDGAKVEDILFRWKQIGHYRL
jgi:uncharacterized protein